MKQEENEIKIDEEKEEQLMNDQLDLLAKAIKVHTTEIDLNEDSTLADLNVEFTRMAKYIIEQMEIIGILKDFLKTNKKIIKYSNSMEEWGKEITYENPEERHYKEAKEILINRVHSMLILSRSVKGKPLKSFLTYGRDVSNKELGIDEKRSMMDKILGKNKPKDKDEDE